MKSKQTDITNNHEVYCTVLTIDLISVAFETLNNSGVRTKTAFAKFVQIIHHVEISLKTKNTIKIKMSKQHCQYHSTSLTILFWN